MTHQGGVDWCLGKSLRELDELSVIPSLPLKLPTPKRLTENVFNKFVLVWPLNSNCYPRGVAPFGRARGEPMAVMCVSAAFQLIEAAMESGAVWFIETVQNADLRAECDAANDLAVEQVWRAVSVVGYRIWVVADVPTMQIMSAMFRTQYVQDNSAPAAPNAQADETKPRKRKRSATLDPYADPKSISVSPKAILSVYKLVEVYHNLFDSDRRAVVPGKDITYDLNEGPARGSVAQTEVGVNFDSTEFGSDAEDTADVEITATPNNEDAPTAAPQDDSVVDAGTGLLSLPSTHVFAPLLAQNFFNTTAIRSQNAEAGVLNSQCELDSYLAGDGHRLTLVFDEAAGGPIRSSFEIERWCESTSDLLSRGLPDRVEPDYASAIEHRMTLAFQRQKDPYANMPQTWAELLRLYERDEVDPSESGSPWPVPIGLTAGNAAVAGDSFAPQENVLVSKLYRSVFATKAQVTRAFDAATVATQDRTDLVWARVVAPAYHGVFCTPGDIVPSMFYKVHVHTMQLRASIRRPPNGALQFAAGAINATPQETILKVAGILNCPVEEALTVTFSTLRHMWTWGIAKMYKTSNRQAKLYKDIRDIQGSIGEIRVHGSNPVVLLLGEPGVGKSWLSQLAGSGVAPQAVTQTSARTDNSRLAEECHCLSLGDDNSREQGGHKSLRNTGQSGRAMAKKRQVQNQVTGHFETHTYYGFSVSHMEIDCYNFTPHAATFDRATIASRVPKAEDTEDRGGTITELACGPSLSHANRAGSALSQLVWGETMAYWPLIAILPSGVGGVDETMLKVASAVCRSLVPNFDDILSARKLEHARTIAISHMALRFATWRVYFKQNVDNMTLMKMRAANAFITGEDAMYAFTTQLNMCGDEATQMCFELLGHIKSCVSMLASRNEFHCHHENCDYVMTDIAGKNCHVEVKKALCEMIPKHCEASIATAFAQLLELKQFKRGGQPLFKVNNSMTPPQWAIKRDAIFCKGVMSPCELVIWASIRNLIDMELAKGMWDGLVRLSFDETEYVLTATAMRILRNPRRSNDGGSVGVPVWARPIANHDETMLLSTLTLMAHSAGSLQSSSTLNGPTTMISRETCAFSHTDSVSPDFIEVDAHGLIGKVYKGQRGANNAVFKRRRATDACAAITVKDYEAVCRLIDNACVLSPGLTKAWNVVLRSEGVVPDGSKVAVMVDPGNTATGACIHKVDYASVGSVTSVKTPGFRPQGSSAFAVQCDTLANTLLPNTESINVDADASYGKKIREAKANAFNLASCHFCPITLADL